MPWVYGLTTGILVAGIVVGLLFSRFIFAHVFNRTLPSSLSPYLTFIQIIHPLSIIFRFSTAWMRCLPDLYILGEVRCGTTSLCAMVVDEMDVRGPFTPFVHPLAGKESFYLVGHYWGCVHPFFYRMCFPTVIERWLYTRFYGRKMIIYDGCAQYLNSPWVAGMIKNITPNAVVVACIREPVAQNESWWKFEGNSQVWANSLGLPSKPAPFRINYPPRSMGDAIRLSQSIEIKKLFDKAEGIKGPFLPSWAVPTPNGQLSGLTQMTWYARNIERYVELFGKEKVVISPVERLSSNPSGIIQRIKRALMLSRIILPTNTKISDSRDSKESNPIIPKRLNMTSKKSVFLSAEDRKQVEILHREQNKDLAELFNKTFKETHPSSEVPSWLFEYY